MSDIQKELAKWIRDKGLERSLQILGRDSNTSNTGWRAGIISLIEKLIGRKLHWLICMAHTNELGIRHHIQKWMEKLTPKRDILVFWASY